MADLQLLSQPMASHPQSNLLSCIRGHYNLVPCTSWLLKAFRFNWCHFERLSSPQDFLPPDHVGKKEISILLEKHLLLSMHPICAPRIVDSVKCFAQ